MPEAAEAQEFERAAKYRDLISTVEQLQEKQRMAPAEGDDADVLRLSLRKSDAGREPVPHAGREGAGPARVFLGRPAEFESATHFWMRTGGAEPQAAPATSIRASFSPLCSSNFIWISRTCRETFTFPSILKTGRSWPTALSEIAGEGARATRVHISCRSAARSAR